MDKFSNLKLKDKFDDSKDKVVFDGEYFKVIEYEDWHVIKENDAVVCIPFLVESNQFIIRYEYIPPFKYTDGQEYHITVLSGGVEMGENPEKTLIRELEEEAGIVLRDDFEIDDNMKSLFISKANTNKYHPYILPLNERDYHEVIAKGDGSREEKLSKSVKIDVKYLSSLNTSDLITDYMLLKLKEYLNL